MDQEDSLWYKDAIIYELPVKAFFDGNADGVGDFPGLISKLDYLQELGVNTLWLLPFYPSPGKDDGYDISDYHGIHPSFGTMDDFRQLIKEAHERGLRVITELVINHTSDQHPWFQAARRAPRGSTKRNYYIWSDDNTRFSETRIIFTDSETSNWAWDDIAQAYYWHRFFSHQPDLNYGNSHVFKAMMHAMRFWFDAGVDGMRLDAVPYLCVREGTSNENLPETHDIVRQMRAELDLHYRNRMFLAEANQWPEDVRGYFADGDECHMAYHFPLMPRMYMAMAQEDRHPIVEIMDQTPDIPANCQWAVFLRNHDELTLEMVTDRERDYLYQAYANDPHARLNLGIRRRLAPLLENDRNRIELMNLLLMTITGSPIIYYGDEIGMGDNISLGDRNGVRTPMQWSGGNNGGFSVAAARRIVPPPITDPIYGFSAVNVASQQSNPSSLLNWMRRLIAMRKAHPAFGRGTLRFLRPGNRKILAYLREHENESILCVANLSRAPQAVELDLATFKGRIPVELMGRSHFPPIGDLPYLLTLGSHGFYAFRLATDVEPPAWHEERPLAPDLPVLVLLDKGWRTLFAQAETNLNQLMVRRARDLLEREIVPHFLRSQTWFRHHPAAVEKYAFDTIREWDAGTNSWLIATISVTLAGGEVQRYAVPLGLAWEDTEEDRVKTLMHASLAKVRLRSRVGILFDAYWDDDFCFALVQGMERGETMEIGEGSLEFRLTSAYTGLARPHDQVKREVTLHGRLRININDRLILKGYRQLLEGIHPELEVTRFLTGTARFSQIPQLAGTLEYIGREGGKSTLAILESYAENQGDAREYTLDYLERFLDECRSNAGQKPDTRHAAYLVLMKTLGRRTAQFHQALAMPDDAGAFGSENLAPDDIADWANRVRSAMNYMFELLEKAQPELTDMVQQVCGELFAQRPRLYRRIMRTASLHIECVKTRCHGDYHLGQVWLSNNDFIIANYAGGFGETLEERRRKYCVLRDVAHMMLSIDEVGAYALDHVAGDSAEVLASLENPVEEWVALARRAFYLSYRKAMSGHPSLPADSNVTRSLLLLAMTENAINSVTASLVNHTANLASAIRQLTRIARRRRVG
jgi:maltose alpha-D-glucosyltransferase/alpha-amylase